MAGCEKEVNSRRVQPDIVQLVENAIARGDSATMERAVNRFRWDPYGEWQTPKEPGVEKPKVNP